MLTTLITAPVLVPIAPAPDPAPSPTSEPTTTADQPPATSTETAQATPASTPAAPETPRSAAPAIAQALPRPTDTDLARARWIAEQVQIALGHDSLIDNLGKPAGSDPAGAGDTGARTATAAYRDAIAALPPAPGLDPA